MDPCVPEQELQVRTLAFESMEDIPSTSGIQTTKKLIKVQPTAAVDNEVSADSTENEINTAKSSEETTEGDSPSTVESEAETSCRESREQQISVRDASDDVDDCQEDEDEVDREVDREQERYEQSSRRNDGRRNRARRRNRRDVRPSRAQLNLQDANINLEGITPPPPALVSTTIPSNQYFRSKYAGNLAAVQLTCGIALLVCGFGISEGVQGSHLPFYFSTMMPLWVGAIYMLTAISGTAAVNNKRKIAIAFYMVFAIISLCLSVLLCAFILPDVTSYETDACFTPDDVDYNVTTAASTEDDQMKCNEAKLLTVLSYITLGFGFIDALSSFAICVVCARALCSVCAKPAFRIVQEAPIFFRVGRSGEMEANILTGASTRPVVVSLPRYDEVVGGTTHTNVLDNQVPGNATPPTPPPSYSSMRDQGNQSNRPTIPTISWEVDHVRNNRITSF